MIKFLKLAGFANIFFLLTSTAFGQSKSDKQLIDSIIAASEKTSLVQKSYVGDSLKAIYFIDSKTESVKKIEVETLDKFSKRWIYSYYLDSNQRLLNMSADKIDGKVFRLAMYYFKDDKLVYKKETNAKIDNPEKQIDSVTYLLDKKPH